MIECKNLSFAYDGQEEIFHKANIVLDSSWKLGLIGRNGRGKSTLLNLLQGKLPFQGEIFHKVAFTYFPLEIPDKSQLTLFALQELVEIEQWKLERELNLLSVNPEVLWQPFETLSGGEQTKILLACMFLEENNFPLLDEPTNHLDRHSREKVANYLKKKKQGFILVSHDRHFVDLVCDHILSIEKNQLWLQKGNFTSYHTQKLQKDKSEQEENERLKGEIIRLKKTAREKADWSGAKEKEKRGAGDKGFVGARAARLMKRSKSLEKRMESEMLEKEKLLKNVEFIDELKMNPTENYHEIYLNVENFSLCFDEKMLFSPQTFALKRGERLAITGKNGSGKSQLIQAILGQFTGETKGICQLTKGLSLSIVRQNYEDNTGNLRDFAEKEQIDYETFLSNLKKLGMERATFTQNIETMSLGQQKKVELAKSISRSADLYIWDEPLNYLDIENLEQIEKMLQKVKPTLLFVEHDKIFVRKIATKQVTLSKT